MSETTTKYGLIAGNGKFPFMVLESARERKADMVVAAIKEETFSEIESCGFPVYWLGLGQLGKLIRFFRKEGVSKAMMAGQVRHVQIFGSSLPDLTMIKLLTGLKHKSTDALIGAVARVLAESGIELIDSTEFLKPYMAPEGMLTKRGFSQEEQADLEFGRPIAHRIALMDIGQTVVVRDRAVVAVEAMEGTDATIRRAGELAGGKHLSVIKVSKPRQDMRFDVPVVGPPTVENMVAAGATALALDAYRTLLVDRSQFTEMANRANIAIVALPPIE